MIIQYQDDEIHKIKKKYIKLKNESQVNKIVKEFSNRLYKLIE